MPIVRTALLVAVLSAGFIVESSALSFKSLSGKWCGETTNYVFAPKSLTVTFLSGSPPRKFKVTSYEYLADTIKMHWESKDEKLFTDFSEFSADGRFMAQQKNEVGPRRPFRRCK